MLIIIIIIIINEVAPQVKTNIAKFSAECHSVDCSGDSKVSTELQKAIRSKLLF